MRSGRLARRLPVIAGGVAIIATVGLTAACGREAEEAPPTTTTTTTTTTTATTPPPPPAPPVAPTEKTINPTGGNLFTPPIIAPPAPTAPPGDN